MLLYSENIPKKIINGVLKETNVQNTKNLNGFSIRTILTKKYDISSYTDYLMYMKIKYFPKIQF